MRPIAGLFAVSLLWCAAAAAAELPFKTTTAVYQNVPETRVFDAEIEAVNRSTVSAQISGRVTQINFDVDDYVRKGDVLVRFRDTEQRAAVNAAQARFNEAQAEFKRISDLYDKKLVAKSAYDKAQADRKSARANLDLARERLAHTVVRAPYAGIVIERHVELGETANAGQPLMTGISLESLRVTAHVPQELIGRIREHNHARVLVGREEDGGKVLVSENLTVFPYADPKSHTFRVRVHLPKEVQGLYPGMFAKVAFTVGEQRRLLLPREAIAHRSEVTAVYVVGQNGTISLRQIRTGKIHDGMVEVLAGLDAGETVALSPVAAAVYLKQREAGRGAHE